MTQEDISTKIKQYLEELLRDKADGLENTSPLISSGVLDSIAALQLVTFLEDTFDIKIKAREVGIDYMETVEDITKLVVSKQSG